MCGIIGVVVKNQEGVMNRLKTIYRNQESRGRQGAGFVIKRGKEMIRERTQKPESALKILAKRQGIEDNDKILFHHRFPTSTPNIANLNHPMSTEDGSIYLIHNGHISNYESLFKEMKKTHRFETYYKPSNKEKAIITDSEVMLHSLEDELKKGKIKKAFKQMMKQIEGNYAIACFIKSYDKIFLFKNSHNPIIVFKDDKENFYFASEFPKREGFTKIRELIVGELGFLDDKGYTQIEIIDTPKDEKKNHWGYYFHSDKINVCRLCGAEIGKTKSYCHWCRSVM